MKRFSPLPKASPGFQGVGQNCVTMHLLHLLSNAKYFEVIPTKVEHDRSIPATPWPAPSQTSGSSRAADHGTLCPWAKFDQRYATPYVVVLIPHYRGKKPYPRGRCQRGRLLPSSNDQERARRRYTRGAHALTASRLRPITTMPARREEA